MLHHLLVIHDNAISKVAFFKSHTAGNDLLSEVAGGRPCRLLLLDLIPTARVIARTALLCSRLIDVGAPLPSNIRLVPLLHGAQGGVAGVW